MRRVVFSLMLLALFLTACGTGTADLAPVTPPNATEIKQSGAAQVDKVLSDWQNSVPQAMEDRAIKADTIKQTVYRTNDSLENVRKYYQTTFDGQNGWTHSKRTPGLDAQQGILVDGYEHGTTSLIVGALDASKYGGQGVVIYTATGHK